MIDDRTWLPDHNARYSPSTMAELEATGRAILLKDVFFWLASHSGHDYWARLCRRGGKLTAAQIERAKVECALIAMGVTNERR